ncbi:fungal-trans domain-containing protein, partial [Favolaschia claudopus]
CSQCSSFGLKCTYNQPHKKRGPKLPKDMTLEQLQKENQDLKHKLASSSSTCSVCSQRLDRRDTDAPTPTRDASVGSPPVEEPSDDTGLSANELAARFSQFSLTTTKFDYLGEDSSFVLAGQASVMKEKIYGPSQTNHFRRPYFWQVLPWEKETLDARPHYVFPAPDLIDSLIHLYFTNVHPTLPLLHQPSFRRDVARGLHFRNLDFGGVLLMVLAVASRYSRDPRVFAMSGVSLSSGWKFASQVQVLNKHGEDNTIHEIQMYCLMALFKYGTSMPHSIWLYTGLGIRCLQQRGVHRRKPATASKLEEELWKRALWSLIVLERNTCLFVGHPIGLHVEQYDFDLPLEIDDEYLDQDLEQPPGKPSQLSYYVCMLKLYEIHRRYIQHPSSSQSVPSLSICANAARAIVHTADIWITELQRLPLPLIYIPVFVSGVVLVLYALATRRTGIRPERNQDLARVATALKMLKFTESRMQPAGRHWELLRELWLLDGPPPLYSSPPSSTASESSTLDASFINMNTSNNMPGQAFPPGPDQAVPSWNRMLSRDPTPEEALQGKSVEELLGLNGDSSSNLATIFDEQLMSLWMAPPDDPQCVYSFFLRLWLFSELICRNVPQWQWAQTSGDRNQSSADVNWPHVFGAQYAPVIVAGSEKVSFSICFFGLLTSAQRDEGKEPDDPCAQCSAFGSSCTYDQPYKKRGPKLPNDATLERLEKENADLRSKLASISICSVCSRRLEGQDDLKATPLKSRTPIEEPSDSQGISADDLADRFSQFSLTSTKMNYLGEDSGLALVKKTISASFQLSLFTSHSLWHFQMKDQMCGPSLVTHLRRPSFWQILPWEKETLDTRMRHLFPHPDLIDSLVNLYFANVHPTIPVLHRPSFERDLAQGLHFQDLDFGGVLLSVLAVASRYSRDPRVFDPSGATLSSGWQFASQVQFLNKHGEETTLHEVQTYCLMALYKFGTSMPHSAWLYTGLGIRSLQQRGIHRRKPDSFNSTLADELWKRALWSLIAIERSVCLFVGHPIGLQVEQYDFELPLEIDDEFLDQGLPQPVGKPSQLSYYILGDVLRRLYDSKKAKIQLGWDGPEWEHRAVAEFDGKMNNFLAGIPPHLRWNLENPPKGTFFDQAATLQITYNYILIAIHRRYIQQPSSLHSISSLAICANAARAIVHTADIWLTELQRMPLPAISLPIFVAGVFLVLYVLATRRAGIRLDNTPDLARVATALKILKFAESRIQPCGRHWELLHELWLLDGPQDSPLGGTANDSLYPSFSMEPSDTVSEQGLLPEENSGDLLWNSMLPRHPTSEDSLHGKSIEDLLGFNGESPSNLANIFDEQLMSLWTTAPADTVYVETLHDLASSSPSSFLHRFCRNLGQWQWETQVPVENNQHSGYGSWPPTFDTLPGPEI